MRSKLFVPASRPELFAKALASEADAVSFDLEDAVAMTSKAVARAHLEAFLRCHPKQHFAKQIIVRVNPVQGELFNDDLEAVVWSGLHVINLPKIEDADQVLAAVSVLERWERIRGLECPIRILATIESPRGLRRAASIALADPRVIGLQIGYGDLFAPLGIASAEPAATQAVRMTIRLAAGEAGIDALDGAFVAVDDSAGFRREAQAARQLGFTGKSCIHPSQVGIANDVFSPSHDEIASAREVVAASDRAAAMGLGAFLVDGKMFDGPFIQRARRVVEVSRRVGAPR